MKQPRNFLIAFAGAICALAIFLIPLRASAGTTGTITGTVADAASGAPIANVSVTAVSPSGSQRTVTNSSGFYSLQQLIPDTYTVSFQAQGYEPLNQPGITVQQDLTSRLDQRLQKSLKTIATVQARSAGNLVKPYTGTDVYNVSGAQLNAATGGDNLHRTVYEYLDTVPGVTPIGGGYPAEPSIRGGYDVDNGYELDGIPITERVTGFFTTNLTDLGISNVEVYTGGLGAQNAGNGMGIINNVIKSGTYPGFANAALGIYGPDFGHFFRGEVGGATPNKMFSWYFGFDAANTQNTYYVGGYQQGSFPITDTGISISNPAYIWTRDFIANFHYRPDPKNDFQVFYQNGVYDGLSNYGINYPNQFALAPCPGATANSDTASNAQGGTAPNGAACPLGLYITRLDSGQGNRTGHYSGIGKIQWNHLLSDHSSIAIRLAENFNQYIFDQKFSDPNSPINNVSSGGTQIDSGCPQYPYTIGAPLPASDAGPGAPYGTSAGGECTFDLGDYWQSRRASQYYGSLDYTSTPNQNVTIKAGFGQEYDWSIRDVRYLNLFDYVSTTGHYSTCYGGTFSYPCHNALTDTPTHVPYFYLSGSFNVGRFTLEPGFRTENIYYGFGPSIGGPKSQGLQLPSFLGTYRVNPSNVLRFSYADSGQFIGTEFVYRLHSSTYNPQTNPPEAYQPQVNHVTDLMWEHQFDANTSLKVGPYYRATNNYLGFFQPFLGFKPGTNVPMYGDLQLKSGLKIRALGAELGFAHVDPRDTGVSVWVSGSYNNYWTQVSAINGGQISFINFPLPDDMIQKGIYVRGYEVPLLTTTLTMDLHTHGWHLLPVIYYSYGNFYNAGACNDPTQVAPFLDDCASAVANTGTAPVLAPEGIGPGYWYVNATISKDLNKKFTVGLRFSNLTNNQKSTTPCWNANPNDPNALTGIGTGCAGYSAIGSHFRAPVGWVYQPLTQDPFRIEGFVNIHM